MHFVAAPMLRNFEAKMRDLAARSFSPDSPDRDLPKAVNDCNAGLSHELERIIAKMKNCTLVDGETDDEVLIGVRYLF